MGTVRVKIAVVDISEEVGRSGRTTFFLLRDHVMRKGRLEGASTWKSRWLNAGG